MAILDTLKSKKTPAKKSASAEKTVREKKGLHIQNVISRPRITEKAAIMADDNNAYSFIVDQRATKIDILHAVKLIYKVQAIRVNVINSKPKQVRRRNTIGTKSGFKKAIVFLKDGDKIEFV